MKRILAVLIAAVMLLSAASALAEPFRVGMECAYAPFNWQQTEADENSVPIDGGVGYAGGYDVEIARRIADGLGRELVIVKLEWDGLIPALQSNMIDAVIAGMSPTAERKMTVSFSDSYYTSNLVVVVRKDGAYADATRLSDFAGAKITGQLNTFHYTVIDQIEGVEHLSPVGSVPDMISRLQQGTCDAIVINVENAQGYLASNPNFRLVTFDEGSGFTLPAKGSCVGLRKSDNELLDQINTILSGIDDDARAAMWQAAVDGQPQ